MRVMKFGGGILKSRKDLEKVASLVSGDCVVVVSALNGVTDLLEKGMRKAVKDECSIKSCVKRFKAIHKGFLHSVSDAHLVEEHSNRLANYLTAISFLHEISPRSHDRVVSIGEEASCNILKGYIPSAQVIDPLKYVITDGKYGSGTVDLKRTEKALKGLSRKGVHLVPGFYGGDGHGNPVTLGRGGSDYTATALGAALKAEKVMLWKDVPGFLTSDPRMVPDARLLEHLSYLEAAELSYFGAKILHPRCTEPARLKNITIEIWDFSSKKRGTVISAKKVVHDNVIKSVAASSDLALLKLKGAAVGHVPGVLGKASTALFDGGVNILSVLSSQTTIAFILNRDDAERSRDLIASSGISEVRDLEIDPDLGLIGVVGEGILKKKGLAAKVFSAVAGKGINVESISAGASDVAYYFMVKKQDLAPAIRAMHAEMFGKTMKNSFN